MPRGVNFFYPLKAWETGTCEYVKVRAMTAEAGMSEQCKSMFGAFVLRSNRWDLQGLVSAVSRVSGRRAGVDAPMG